MNSTIANCNPDMAINILFAGGLLGMAVMVAILVMVWVWLQYVYNPSKQRTGRPGPSTAQPAPRGMANVFASEMPNRISPDEKPKMKRVRVNNSTYYVKGGE